MIWVWRLAVLALLVTSAGVSAQGERRRVPSTPWPDCPSDLPGSPCVTPLPREFPRPIIAPPPPPRPDTPDPGTQFAPAKVCIPDRGPRAAWKGFCKDLGNDGQPLPGSQGGAGGPGAAACERLPTPDARRRCEAQRAGGTGGNGGGSGGGDSGDGGGSGGYGNLVLDHGNGKYATNVALVPPRYVWGYPERCAVIVARSRAEAEYFARIKNLPSPPPQPFGLINRRGAASVWCATPPGQSRQYFLVQGQQTGVPNTENAISQSRERAWAVFGRRISLSWVFGQTF